MTTTARRSRLLWPLILAAVLYAAYWALEQRPLRVGELGDIRELVFGRDLRYLLFLAALALILEIVRLFDAVVFGLVFSRKRGVDVPLLLREIVSVGLYLVILAAVASHIFKTSITGILATGTVLAAVVGLALQDTLGNLFSGISLHMEGTFDTGDVIRSGEHIGVVERVSWRATRIRTFENNVVLLPNSMIARERIEIFPRANANARIITVGVSYEVPPERVIAVLERATANVEEVATDIPPIARVGGFGDSSVTYEIKYFTRHFENRDTIDADIRRAVWYALQRNGIPIPFPIRSIQQYTSPAATRAVSRDEILARINSVGILAPLSPGEHETLADGTVVRTWAPGETIIRQGEPGESMFVIHAGTVSVRIPNGSGMAEVAELGPGRIFGEMALLTGDARTASVVATSELTALEIGKDALQPVLSANPALAAAVWTKVRARRSASPIPSPSDAEEEKSVLRRIRSYFGL